LNNRPSPLKNANGRLGVGGHVVQFAPITLGSSHKNDIAKKENNVRSIKIIAKGNRSSTPPLKKRVMHQIRNQSMICGVLRNKLKLCYYLRNMGL